MIVRWKTTIVAVVGGLACSGTQPNFKAPGASDRCALASLSRVLRAVPFGSTREQARLALEREGTCNGFKQVGEELIARCSDYALRTSFGDDWLYELRLLPLREDQPIEATCAAFEYGVQCLYAELGAPSQWQNFMCGMLDLDHRLDTCALWRVGGDMLVLSAGVNHEDESVAGISLARIAAGHGWPCGE